MNEKNRSFSKIDLFRAIPDVTYTDFIQSADPNVAASGMNRVLTVVRARHRCDCREDLNNAIEFAALARTKFELFFCDAERTITWVKSMLPARASARLDDIPQTTPMDFSARGSVGIVQLLTLAMVIMLTIVAWLSHSMETTARNTPAPVTATSAPATLIEYYPPGT